MPVSLPLVRPIVLATTNLLALIVLCLSAYTYSQTASYLGVYFPYSALGIATAVIHIASVSAVSFVGRLRDGAFTSKVAFQVGWLSYLCVMWLATGAQTAATLGAFTQIAATLGGIVGCTDVFCGVTQAIAALGFFNWIILLGYVATLTAAAWRAGQTGNNIWLTDVKELRWIPGPINHEKSNINSFDPSVATYPPGGNPNYGLPPVAPQPQLNYQYGGRPPV